MKELKIIFSITAALFAAIPGIGLLSANLEIIPGESRMLYGGVLEALSLMTLLILWLRKKKIEALTPSQAIKRAILCLSLFLIILMGYIFLLQSHVREKLVFPIFQTGDLRKAILKEGSFDNIIAIYHEDGTKKLIETSNETLILTKLFFLILFQIPMVMLVISFGIIGINVRVREEFIEKE